MLLNICFLSVSLFRVAGLVDVPLGAAAGISGSSLQLGAERVHADTLAGYDVHFSASC